MPLLARLKWLAAFCRGWQKEFSFRAAGSISAFAKIIPGGPFLKSLPTPNPLEWLVMDKGQDFFPSLLRFLTLVSS